jgi:hypothetical protein
VNHAKLKQKLHMNEVRGNYWNLVDQLYSNITECVKWKGSYSPGFDVQKGVRQGAVMSTTLYKLYVNDLLDILQKSDNGTHLGCTYIGSPTCADDILLIANDKSEMQSMISTCYSYASEHQYVLHPLKSTVTPYLNVPDSTVDTDFTMGPDKMPSAEGFSHLGLDWTQSKVTPSVEARIRLARNTTYALMGAGVHGTNGLSPVISMHIVRTYVIPRLLYGLEAVVLSKKQREDLNMYHKHLLRQLQGLPSNTATEAIYILLGEIPLEAYLDLRILSLYGAICRAEDNKLLQEITTRQLALDNRRSWFQEVLRLCATYHLEIDTTRNQPWRKATWKKYINDAVKGYWTKQLLQGASNKSSMKWVNLENTKDLLAHPVWLSCKLHTRSVPAASTRAKLLTRTFLVQERKAKFSKMKEEPICPLCQQENEDVTHFLVKCPELEEVRKSTAGVLDQMGIQLDLNSTASVKYILNGPEKDTEDMKINRTLNELCHRLHTLRFRLLDRKANPIP